MNISLHDLFGYAAGILMIIVMFPYVRSIVFTRETKLNRASWAIWGTIGIINLAAYFCAGERETIWFVIASALNPVIIFILSLKFGEKRWHASDTACLALAAVALIIWKLTGNPVLALVAGLTADVLGGIPTFLKVIRNPHSENLAGWAIGLAASICNVFAVKQWTVANSIYTGYMVFAFLIIIIPIAIGQSRKTASLNR